MFFVLKFCVLNDIDDWNSLLCIDLNGMLLEVYNSMEEVFELELQFGGMVISIFDFMVKVFCLD